MSESDILRVKEIEKKSFIVEGENISLLTEDEALNLSIERGTLSEKERQKIIEIDLTEEEKTAFAHSVDVVKKTCEEVDDMLSKL